ncbi:MAG: hypothetical protein PHP27_07025 [Bacteroidales bacterium]|nr:hypothetical protein [Bacteroidales bacterium]
MNKIYIFLIAILLYSCNKETQQVKKKKLDYFVEHTYTVDGKKIKFSLPKWYTDKNIEDKRKLPQYLDHDMIRFSEFVFFSTKCDNSFFLLYIRNDSLDSYLSKYPDNVLDSFIASSMRIYKYYPGTVFTEKKWDKNNHPYYNQVYSCRYYDTMRYEHPIIKLSESDSIESKFTYITYFGMKGYVFIFSSIESINDFSYEEKRQVLESISIYSCLN